MSNQKIQTLLRKLCISSLFFSEKFVLTGVGGNLYIIDSTGLIKLKETIPVFENTTIHGISQSSDKSCTCVFGGKEIAFFRSEFQSSTYWLKCKHKWRVGDWLLCCEWIKDKPQLVALSAHNVLTVWDPYVGACLAQIICAEKCILYCGTVLTRSRWEDTVVITGTVFQQIIVWSVTEDSASERPVLHTLQGHKGVIFSIVFDERSRQIASTSDDRTVRVWSVVSSTSGPLLTENWKNASITLSFTIFGHTARVWQSYILADRSIISVGEDSLLCVWREGGQCVSRRETHQGAGVWCCAVDERRGLVVTGGADDGVTLWPLQLTVAASEALPPPADTPRRITLLRDFRVLVVTDAGALMVFQDLTWSVVLTDPRLASYCLLELSASKQLIGLASINGHIIVLKSAGFTKVLDEQVAEGRIFSLHWLNEVLFVSCHKHGSLIIWKIHSSGLQALKSIQIPNCKERWTTSAVLINETVVFGDRAGNIHSTLLHCGEVCTIARAHSRLGVCSLSVHNNVVWSTGRDGTVKQFIVTNGGLKLASNSKLPYDWAAQTLHTHLFGTLILFFHEAKMVLWSLRERCNLMTIPCAGGHRSWSCLIDDDQFCFTYLKDKTASLSLSRLDQSMRRTLMDGFHTKEVNSMAHIAGGWVASGGEDGTVRVSEFRDSDWTTPIVEHSHLSSVRCVHTCQLQGATLLCSAGGRAQIKMWRINLSFPLSATELCSVKLRDERRGRHWLSTGPEQDPETRFMDLDSFQLSETTLCVLAACSDAYLRAFQFDCESDNLELRGSVRNSQHCLLRVKSFQCDNGRRVAVTGATDGSVTLWDWGERREVISCERVHQCGLNGLSVLRLPADRVLVATGGDDNAVVVTCYKLTAGPLLTVLKTASWSSSTLHSSIVTGVHIAEEMILCSGGDQRVTVLKWNVVEDILTVQFLLQATCPVPDVKGLTVIQSDRDKLIFCVYGVGIEVKEVKREKKGT